MTFNVNRFGGVNYLLMTTIKLKNFFLILIKQWPEEYIYDL